jgi:hypothetical protein
VIEEKIYGVMSEAGDRAAGYPAASVQDAINCWIIDWNPEEPVVVIVSLDDVQVGKFKVEGIGLMSIKDKPDMNGDREYESAKSAAESITSAMNGGPYAPSEKWPCGCSVTHARGEIVWFVCKKHLTLGSSLGSPESRNSSF